MLGPHGDFASFGAAMFGLFVGVPALIMFIVAITSAAHSGKVLYIIPIESLPVSITELQGGVQQRPTHRRNQPYLTNGQPTADCVLKYSINFVWSFVNIDDEINKSKNWSSVLR